MSAIHWFENPAFDAPEMKSPQPCIHGAGCVYTIKLADGKVIPGVCRYVHPGEEGKGRALFPQRTIRDTELGSKGTIVQPACVRLIGNAGYYERMRLKMPWQAWCAAKGIAFTANVPGVQREPVQRIPIGGSKPMGGSKPVGGHHSRASFQSPPPPRRSTEVPIRHIRTTEDQDFLITADRVTLLKPEEAVRFGLRPPPPSAVPTADQSWPVLGGGVMTGNAERTAEATRAAAAAMLAAIAAAPLAARAAASAPVVRLEVVDGEVVATPHPVVEREVVAASATNVWRSSEGLIEEDDDDTCGYCQRAVAYCREHGDHSEEIRDMAAAAAW